MTYPDDDYARCQTVIAGLIGRVRNRVTAVGEQAAAGGHPTG